MTMPALSFIIELEKLKAVLRKNKPLGLDRYENSAEHSWQICMAAIALSPQTAPQVDVTRVVEMLLVHDIPEIDIGDTIVYAARSASDRARERRAALRLFGMLDAQTSETLFARWEEFEAGETREAKFARAVDRLLPVLQNVHNNGQSWLENNISLEQVLKKNAPIGEVLQQVWEQVEPRIRKCFE
jgi:putative hydrolase of HD superfamily